MTENHQFPTRHNDSVKQTVLQCEDPLFRQATSYNALFISPTFSPQQTKPAIADSEAYRELGLEGPFIIHLKHLGLLPLQYSTLVFSSVWEPNP